MAEDSRVKSAMTCVLGGTKISLGVLTSLSDFIPIPYVNLATDAAAQIIKLAEKVKSNRDDLTNLVAQVYELMLVVATSLKGEKEADISKSLKRNLERLSDDLWNIADRMRRLKDDSNPTRLRSLAKSILKYDSNEQIIQDCTKKLDWAVQAFHVQGRIQDTLKLAQISDDMKEVKITVQEMAEGTRVTPKPASLPSNVIPPPPAVLYGRDETVNNIVSRILSDHDYSARLAILGAGGIGKTSVAQAVAGHPDMVKRYGDRRNWVQCDAAISPDLLLELLAQAFHVEKSTPDRLNDIVSTLRLNPQPHFLLLDNFETPWDIEGRQSDIERILRTIAALLHITILVTMRGTLPAATSVRWSEPLLPPLDVLSPAAAQQLYARIHPDASLDPSLTTLLQELDYMPLAVNLMARIGSYGETPSSLLKRFHTEGIDIVDEPGGDRQNSVNRSISLSLNSNLIRKDPESLRLLSVLAVLPGGAQMESLGTLVPSIPNPMRARASLLRASLAYLTPDRQILRVLSPVRSFIARYHPLIPETLREVESLHFKLVGRHNCDWAGNPQWLDNVNILAKEDLNIEAVLLGALRNGGSAAAIEAAVQFGGFQLRRRSRTEVMEATVSAARALKTGSSLAIALRRLAEIQTSQRHLKEAHDTVEEARREFQILGQLGADGAARCLELRGVVEIVQMQLDAAHQSLEAAYQEFEALGSSYKAADCLQERGEVERSQGRYPEALLSLQEARNRFQSIGGPALRDASFCLLNIGAVYVVQKDYQSARNTFEEARRGFMALGDSHEAGRSLLSLGVVLKLQHLYDEAYDTVNNAYLELKVGGDLVIAAECLETLGEIELGREQYEEAHSTLQEARGTSQSVGDVARAARCLYSLGETERAQRRYPEALRTLEAARGECQAIEDPVQAAKCLGTIGLIAMAQGLSEQALRDVEAARRELVAAGNSKLATWYMFELGRIAFIQKKWDEARTVFQQTRLEEETLDDPGAAATCLWMIGKIIHEQNQYDEARTTHRAARQEYQKLGDLVSAAQCLRSIAEVDVDEGNYDEACRTFRLAREEYQAVGDTRRAEECLKSAEEVKGKQ